MKINPLYLLVILFFLYILQLESLFVYKEVPEYGKIPQDCFHSEGVLWVLSYKSVMLVRELAVFAEINYYFGR